MEEGKSYVPEASFTSLVLTLSSSAWVALGKVTDPVSGEIKKDLRGAKLTIDLLMMLREKTKGNLSGDEERLLSALISDLQGNYAETVFEESKAEKVAAGEPGSTGSQEPAKPSKEEEKKEAGNARDQKAEGEAQGEVEGEDKTGRAPNPDSGKNSQGG